MGREGGVSAVLAVASLVFVLAVMVVYQESGKKMARQKIRAIIP